MCGPVCTSAYVPLPLLFLLEVSSRVFLTAKTPHFLITSQIKFKFQNLNRNVFRTHSYNWLQKILNMRIFNFRFKQTWDWKRKISSNPAKMCQQICRAHKLHDFNQNLLVKNQVCMRVLTNFDICQIKKNIFFQCAFTQFLIETCNDENKAVHPSRNRRT